MREEVNVITCFMSGVCSRSTDFAATNIKTERGVFSISIDISARSTTGTQPYGRACTKGTSIARYEGRARDNGAECRAQTREPHNNDGQEVGSLSRLGCLLLKHKHIKQLVREGVPVIRRFARI
jgi:hypothetical protein